MARRRDPEMCSEALARRLRWHVYTCISQGADCSLLTIHPVQRGEQTSGQGPLQLTLAPLAERLGRIVRASDAIEVDVYRGIGLALYGAGREGARAVFERLRETLHVAADSGVTTQMMAIGLATSAADWRDEEAILGAIRSAWRPRAVIAAEVPAIALAAGAEDTGRTLSARAEAGSHSARASRIGVVRGKPSGAATDAPPRRPRLRVLVVEQVSHEHQALREQARALGVPFVELPQRISVPCRGAVAPELARELRAVPIGRTRGMLTVAMHDPHDHEALRRLGAATGLAIFPVLAAPDALDRALRQLAHGS